MNLESETMSRCQYQIKNHDIEAKNKDYEKKAVTMPFPRFEYVDSTNK